MLVYAEQLRAAVPLEGSAGAYKDWMYVIFNIKFRLLASCVASRNDARARCKRGHTMTHATFGAAVIGGGGTVSLFGTTAALTIFYAAGIL